MTSFIQLVAQDIIRRFGTSLRDVTVVFPNKRAGLFMNQELAAASDKPVWAPRYQTISELFDTLSPYTRCDQIQAVCELYRIYTDLVPEPESLDRFYGWGEIMLSDFDDIDKHLVNVHKLFSNIQAIKELDDSTFLTENQESALKRFFEGFSVEGNSRLKEKFLQLWNRMDDLYTRFNETLSQKGLLYEGALYRDAVTHLDTRSRNLPPDRTYVFVGFNVLNEVEKTVFRFLQEKGKALFYWDYDVMYVRHHLQFEAGTFIRENLKNFPNALPESLYDNFGQPKQIEFIATSSENAQARHIPQWLDKHLTQPEQDTAIVLCNESMLQPVLHALPDSSSEHPVRHTNITMGFPLSDTPIYSFINAVFELQTEGFDHDRKCFRKAQENTVRHHPYASLLAEDQLFVFQQGNLNLLTYLRKCLEELAAQFGRKEKKNEVYDQLYHEALFRAYTVLGRFCKLTEDGILQVQPTTLKRLLRTVMSTTTIPFHGEPAIGLQIMGVLETRNLNFKHILMLSVNEGMLPKSVNDTSFIPYHLREVFGLTTVRHKIAVYAFYFYRLLQRTERVTLMYNTATDGNNKGEMSRFLRQLLAETQLPISAKILQAGQAVSEAPQIEVQKTAEVMKALYTNYAPHTKGSRPLSPSALNYYLDCPLKFYYAQIARIRKPKDPQEGIDGAIFGTLFHDAAELAYQQLTTRNPVIRKEDIDRLLEHPEVSLQPFVEASFLKNYFDNQKEEVFYNGQLLIAKKVIISYLKQLLEYDRKMEAFVLKEMEQEHKLPVEIKSGDRVVTIDIGGKIDRMDLVKISAPDGAEVETLRIVDYKTGGSPEKAGQMDQLVIPAENRPKYMLQTFLYAWVVSENQQLPVMPALFFVHKSNKEDYSPAIEFNKATVYDFNTLKEEFKETLLPVLEEIFNPELPFRQTSINKHCLYCDYKSLCGK